MLPAERENARVLIYEVLPSRYGINIHHLRQADAIELTIGQGAKPGTGGLLLGSKVSAEIARHARPAAGRRSAQPVPAPRLPRPRRHDHQDRGAARGDRLAGAHLRQAGRQPRLRRREAGRQGRRRRGRGRRHGGRHRRLARTCCRSTPASRPWPPCARPGPRWRSWGCTARCNLIIAGGIRHGSDAAKALALGADAVYVGTAALIALNCNKPLYVEDYHALGAAPYACHHCHTGRCPVGITTQDPELMKRLEIDAAAERVANWLHAVDVGDPDPGPGLRQARRPRPGAGGPARPDAGGVADHRPAAGRHQHASSAAAPAGSGTRRPLRSLKKASIREDNIIGQEKQVR